MWGVDICQCLIVEHRLSNSKIRYLNFQRLPVNKIFMCFSAGTHAPH